MKRNFYLERECVHREQGSEGELYNGPLYVQAIQRLPCQEALRAARRVEQFYWSDAANIRVWLCHECANLLHLKDAPRMVISAAPQPRRVSIY